MAIKKIKTNPFDEQEFIDDLLYPLQDIVAETNYNVLSVISNRLNKVGNMSASDAQRLSQIVRMQDLAEIKLEIAKGTKKTLAEVDKILDSAAEKNDQLSENLYVYRGMSPSSFKLDKRLGLIVNEARKSIKDDIVNLSKTRTMRLTVNGRQVVLADAYNYAVNRGIFEVSQGVTDYQTAIRTIVKDLSKNGLAVVNYESGTIRRLDSAVRANTLGGVSMLNQEYRREQGRQYGADGIELSAHALSEPIHAMYQGKQYSLQEFDRIQSSLERPFFEMNCRHSSFPIILGISEPAYSRNELSDYKNRSEKEVEFDTLQKDKDGNIVKKKISRYDASQAQRSIETGIRRLKDQRNQLDKVNDKIAVSELSKQIKEKTVYYKQVSEQVGLSPKLNRLTVYDGRK
jgi:hypothetical protein